MDFFKLLDEFVNIDRGLFLSCYMDLSKLIHRFLYVVTWIFLAVQDSSISDIVGPF